MMSLFALMLLLPSSTVLASEGYGGGGGSGGGGGGGGGGAGGGGGNNQPCYTPLIPPATGFSVSINGGAATTNAREVNLSFNGGSDATRLAVSNSPAFEASSLDTYVGSKSWTLSEGEGTKMVFARFYNSCGLTTQVVSAKIEYKKVATDSEGRVLGVSTTLIDELIARLRFGQRTADVVKLQDELKRLGFLAKTFPSTGYFGTTTLAAVNRYKASLKNVVKPSTDASIDTLIAQLRFGMRSDAVRLLQDKLKALGFFPRYIRSTGYFGPITQEAIRKYLAAHATK